MMSCSASPLISDLFCERAQSWLGTIVSIRVEGLSLQRANQAIDAAFLEVATVHRLMSFHQPDSDISRLNRAGYLHPVEVHPYTFEVLHCAKDISEASDGLFDVTVGAELVRNGALPQPVAVPALPEGNWRDVELRGDGTVFLHRPVWIDLGGIAKGYAVDRAIQCLREHGATRAVVNAGGDIRVHGPDPEAIGLAIPFPVDSAPIVEIADGSIAGSSSCGAHIDGRGRTRIADQRFACVLSESCIIADALTKVVMAEGISARSTPILERFHASAHVYEPRNGWRHLTPSEAIP